MKLFHAENKQEHNDDNTSYYRREATKNTTRWLPKRSWSSFCYLLNHARPC